MKKQEKLDKFMSQGCTKEQAERLIAYNMEDELTREELAMKFDNPYILDNTYPDWLSEDNHIKYCREVARKTWDMDKLGWFISEYDLAIDLYRWSKYRLSWFVNEKHMKTSLKNRVKNIIRDGNIKYRRKLSDDELDEEQLRFKPDSKHDFFDSYRGESYIGLSLDQPITSEGQEDYYTLLSLKDDRNRPDNEENMTISVIRGIEQSEVKQLCVICGYLLGGLDGLKPDYEYTLDHCEPKVKEGLIKLYEDMDKYNTYISNKQNGVKGLKVVKKPNVLDVINSMGVTNFGFDECEKDGCKKALNEVKQYICSSGLFNGAVGI